MVGKIFSPAFFYCMIRFSEDVNASAIQLLSIRICQPENPLEKAYLQPVFIRFLLWEKLYL
jgi:hypothetical protein